MRPNQALLADGGGFFTTIVLVVVAIFVLRAILAGRRRERLRRAIEARVAAERHLEECQKRSALAEAKYERVKELVEQMKADSHKIDLLRVVASAPEKEVGYVKREQAKIEIAAIEERVSAANDEIKYLTGGASGEVPTEG